MAYSAIIDLIRLILTMNIFKFNNNHYLQTHDTAMGTRMAPSYANLFLAKFETDALKHASATYLVAFHRRHFNDMD